MPELPSIPALTLNGEPLELSSESHDESRAQRRAERAVRKAAEKEQQLMSSGSLYPHTDPRVKHEPVNLALLRPTMASRPLVSPATEATVGKRAKARELLSRLSPVRKAKGDRRASGQP